MHATAYENRRSQVESYFDRTAADAWARLTSDAPVGSIRSTVRAGRDRMRATLLGWLPDDLGGTRILDAGCGTGAMAVELARRGADVMAVDLSSSLIRLAQERTPHSALVGRIDFRVGDMRDAGLGRFDHVIAMDSLIHYACADMIDVLGGLADRVGRSILFTHAPRTPLLAAMHMIGRLFPRGNRAPSIEPVTAAKLRQCIATKRDLAGFTAARTRRIDSGFYISQATELTRP